MFNPDKLFGSKHIMFTSILAAYGLQAGNCEIKPFGTGLINHTWKISCDDREFILQRINVNVFNDPVAVAANLGLMGDYLKQHEPGYVFVVPEKTLQGEELYIDDQGHYRLMPFVKHSVTYDVVPSTNIAYEAARQFGCFTKKFSGMDPAQLKITLPDFHDLSLRHRQFRESLTVGNGERIKKAAAAVTFVESQHHLVDTYQKIRSDEQFRVRVTHHDTKISNVLFDKNGQGICVIDLDTTMPGYFISDAGDMMRTYLCPASEEEKDSSRIEVRDDYFLAIAEGYLEEMSGELSHHEIRYFVYSGEFMIYMQAMRFLTDFFNNDIYYGARYEDHNYVRAQNQLVLLQRFQEKSNLFRKQVLALQYSP